VCERTSERTSERTNEQFGQVLQIGKLRGELRSELIVEQVDHPQALQEAHLRGQRAADRVRLHHAKQETLRKEKRQAPSAKRQANAQISQADQGTKFSGELTSKTVETKEAEKQSIGERATRAEFLQHSHVGVGAVADNTVPQINARISARSVPAGLHLPAGETHAVFDCV
jgi:hypothetical protein